MKHVHGAFDVKLAPQEDTVGDPSIARMAIDKQFHGPLTGVSRGQMLAFRSEVDGSAGYVAMERVTATLEGRAGSFTLQHSGTMNRGAASLTLTVVPDSATGALAGLDGNMAINIVDGAHFYDFDYVFLDAE